VSSAKATRARRVRWFLAGSSALRATLGSHPDFPDEADPFYVCPLCRVMTSMDDLDDNLLTDEDVPPRSAFGRPLVLTCRDCNNDAGSRLDSHAATQERILDFQYGSQPKPLKVHVRDGIDLAARLERRQDTYFLYGVPTASHPSAPALLDSLLDGWRANGSARTLSLQGDDVYIPRLANLSRLRAAYLVAFAMWGYRYAFSPAMDPVRAQLADPYTELFTPLLVVDPIADPHRRALIHVTAPEGVDAIAVVLGRFAVLLPSAGDDTAFFTREYPSLTGHVHLEGSILDWPKGPEHRLDRSAVA
jgi:hypothetical protein